MRRLWTILLIFVIIVGLGCTSTSTDVDDTGNCSLGGESCSEIDCCSGLTCCDNKACRQSCCSGNIELIASDDQVFDGQEITLTVNGLTDCFNFVLIKEDHMLEFVGKD